MVAIVSVSGSGKSTLMNILGCLDKPSYCEYYLAGQNIAQLDDEQLSVLRRLRREYFGFIAKRLNFDYTILSANKISVSHPSALFLHIACAHLCSIGLRSGE
ncbi:Macrolide export ATP-binding/permease protein MacB [Arsenophonus endosymbiont of Bemisia tabaci Q2]|nr:Macrolide export ATP-binding/permease protein MacB [Arsenophonus endosymbiont of Bemisia tabaci Q2]